jgi:rubrerythrin
MKDIETALSVIRRAVQSEIAGQRFYSDASSHCIDPWAKEVFSFLAHEEERHTQLLLMEYQSLDKYGHWIEPDDAMADTTAIDITQFTFLEEGAGEELFPSGWSASDAVDRRADDLAALAFGIEMERQAIAVYGDQARSSTEPAARRAYELLLAEERQHLRKLTERWEQLAGIPFSDA